MARHLLRTFTCVSNSAASYSNGDEIEVFYNDAIDKIEVDLNGSPATSGGPIFRFEFLLRPGQERKYSATFLDYSFCQGENLISFHGLAESFPYAIKSSEKSEACSAAICDLSKSGTVSVTQASSPTTGDGAITVVATSSNTPISYYLGNGRPRSSGVFTNLFPGTYTLFARDDAGCQISWVNVVVGHRTAQDYGEYEQWNYFDKEGIEFKVELLKLNYEGSVTQRDLLDALPTLRNIRGENNSRLVNILPGEFELNAITETDREYLELFREAGDEDFLIKFYRDPGGGFELVWEGFPLVSVYSEEYEKDINYVSTIRATDRLMDLSDYDFLDDGGTQLYGNVSVFDCIRIILRKTNLDFGFRVAMSLYEASHDSTAADDPLTQTFVNVDDYYPDGEPQDCFTVLSKILSSLFCEVFSYGGYWYIMYKPDKEATFAYREFDSSGNYITNSTIDPLVDFKVVTLSDRANWIAGGKLLEGEAVFNKINIVNQRNLTSIVTQFTERNIDGNSFRGWSKVFNGDSGSIRPKKLGTIRVPVTRVVSEFRAGREVVRGGRTREREGEEQFITLDKWFYHFNFEDDQGGNAYIVSSGPIEFKGADSFELKIPVLFNISAKTPPYVRFKYLLKVGSKYLQADGSWDTGVSVNEWFLETYNSETVIDLSGRFDSVSQDTETTYELRIYDIDPYEFDLEQSGSFTLVNWQSLVAALPDASDFDLGTRYVARFEDPGTEYYYFEVSISEGEKFWNLVFSALLNNPTSRLAGSSLYLGSVNFITLPDQELIPETETLTLITSDKNVVDLDYDLAHFDVNTSVNNTENMILNYWRLSDGTPTEAWGANGKKIQQIIGDKIAKYFNAMNYRIRGEFSTDLHITPYNVFRESSDEGRIYMPVFLSIDDRRKRVQIEMVEIASDETNEISAFTSGFKQNAFT